MSTMAPVSTPVDVLAAQTPSADAQRSKIKQAAENYEASFLSVMLAQMFKGVDTEAPFGGGKGEEMFKSFFTDAVAKQVAKSGGIGLSATVEREMLKMQGLQEVPHGA
jgi:flagellar protein FlgJ